jgi:hypothetical protein
MTSTRNITAQNAPQNQLWALLQWFWRFSTFYGQYVPASLEDKQRLTESSL